uniref:Uncharacterized protein n=1 Tax=Plectus sambesii TaxID=2011161 RepID=A0A914WYY8_9BILA
MGNEGNRRRAIPSPTLSTTSATPVWPTSSVTLSLPLTAHREWRREKVAKKRARWTRRRRRSAGGRLSRSGGRRRAPRRFRRGSVVVAPTAVDRRLFAERTNRCAAPARNSIVSDALNVSTARRRLRKEAPPSVAGPPSSAAPTDDALLRKCKRKRRRRCRLPDRHGPISRLSPLPPLSPPHHCPLLPFRRPPFPLTPTATNTCTAIAPPTLAHLNIPVYLHTTMSAGEPKRSKKSGA